MFIVSNIKDAYTGAWKEFQDSKPAFKQALNGQTLSNKDKARVLSVSYKVIGTLGLSFAGFIAVRALLGTRSFAKLFFGTMAFVAGHDTLRYGDNLHRNFVIKERGFVGGAKEVGVKALKLVKGIFAGKGVNEIATQHSADEEFGGTIVFKHIAEIVISSHYKRQQ
ncbi:MAG: hypothetical protein K1060chlam2_01318 [Chlamydiae bacterium]|nr:hypothetical protein [Chlamydiota bacterium]